MIGLYANYRLIRTILGCVLILCLLPGCAASRGSSRAAFLKVYRDIWAVENEFPTSTLPSYEELLRSSKTNFVSIFMHRIDGIGGVHALQFQAIRCLQDYYLETGGGKQGTESCIRLVKQAIQQIGPVYSRHVFNDAEAMRSLATEAEWLEWTMPYREKGSVLFKWINVNTSSS